MLLHLFLQSLLSKPFVIVKTPAEVVITGPVLVHVSHHLFVLLPHMLPKLLLGKLPLSRWFLLLVVLIIVVFLPLMSLRISLGLLSAFIILLSHTLVGKNLIRFIDLLKFLLSSTIGIRVILLG